MGFVGGLQLHSLSSVPLRAIPYYYVLQDSFKYGQLSMKSLIFAIFGHSCTRGATAAGRPIFTESDCVAICYTGRDIL